MINIEVFLFNNEYLLNLHCSSVATVSSYDLTWRTLESKFLTLVNDPTTVNE